MDEGLHRRVDEGLDGWMIDLDSVMSLSMPDIDMGTWRWGETNSKSLAPEHATP